MDLLQLLGEHRAEELGVDLAAVVEHAVRAVDPLPDLAAGDLGGGGVLHQVVDRHAAVAAEPGAEVLDADVDVGAQARLGDRPLGHEGQQVLRRDGDVLALAVDLVRARHERVEDLHRDRHQAGVGDPGAVVAVAGLALLVGAHLRERLLVGRRVVLDRDLGRHAADRVRVARVAGLDRQQRVGRA